MKLTKDSSGCSSWRYHRCSTNLHELAEGTRLTTNASTSYVEGKPDRVLLVELKHGKPVLKQKPLAFEKMSETMQGKARIIVYVATYINLNLGNVEIVKFREMLEEKIERKDTPLDAFPDDHRPLVAKMVHERCNSLIIVFKFFCT